MFRAIALVLVGDPMQLQAIEAGAPFRALAESHRYVSLTDIRRQSTPWQQAATKALALGETKEAINLYAEKSHVHDFQTKQEAKVALTEVWQDARLANPTKTQIMLAYNRDDVRELNDMARDLRRKEGELGKDYLFTTERGERSFAKGDRLYFLKNDKTLGVMNGTLGTITALDEKTLTICLDQANKKSKEKEITITICRYAHIDHGYAATIHKAQGVTVDRSYVLASQYLDAHATYVAMSRHRESVDLFYGKDQFPTQDALIQTLSRERPKDMAVDYLNHHESREEKLALSPAAEEQQRREEKMRSLVERTRALQQERARLRAEKPAFDAKAFQRDYEARNPEKAKALKAAFLPKAEREMLGQLEAYKQLEKVWQERKDITSQNALEKLADQLSKQKTFMQYIEKHDAPRQKAIEQFAREFQRGKDLELER